MGNCTCEQLTPLDTGPGTDGPPAWEQDPDCPQHFLWRTCPGLTGSCGAETFHTGRHLTRTELGLGTVTIGRLCPACSSEAGEIMADADEAGRC